MANTEVGRHRGWVFTVNNWEQHEWDDLVLEFGKYAKYAIMGREVAPETGTPHIQGYVQWKNARDFKLMKKLCERAHWAAAKGSAKANKEYCSKGESFWEMGDVPAPGKRNDLARAKEMVAQGEPMSAIGLEVGYQATRHAQLLYQFGLGKRRDPVNEVHVIWHCGSTGTGKTRSALETYPNAWMSGKNLKWWDGYDGQDEVIIDDFRRDFCTFHELLRILDRYPFRVEVKGGSLELLATKFFVTTPLCPRCTYVSRTEEDISQLTRRVREIRGDCVACGVRYTNTGVGGNTSSPTPEVLRSLTAPPVSEPLVLHNAPNGAGRNEHADLFFDNMKKFLLEGGYDIKE